MFKNVDCYFDDLISQMFGAQNSLWPAELVNGTSILQGCNWLPASLYSILSLRLARSTRCPSRESDSRLLELLLMLHPACHLHCPSLCAGSSQDQDLSSVFYPRDYICICDDQSFVLLLLLLFMLFAFLNKGNLQLQFRFPSAKFSPKIKCFSGGYLEQEPRSFLFPFVFGQSFLFACKVELAYPRIILGRKDPPGGVPKLLLEKLYGEL